MSIIRKENDSLIISQTKKVNTELKDGVFIFTSPMSIDSFSKKIKKPTNEIISYFFKKGKMFNINHILSEKNIAEICLELGYDFQKKEDANSQTFMDNITINDDPKLLQIRPPIITIMGHVDHGKTTLIDKIRDSNIVKHEIGGITQQMKAYQINYKKNKITFFDTPGHEIFTLMRARGAKLTDIIILVVAADDGVMPQTKEAIDNALAAKVPVIVFVNKMDKPQVNFKKVINELSSNNIIVEELGGEVQCIKGSALNGDGINKLFDAINIQAEILEIKANPNRMPIGVVIESNIDKGKGAIATLIVQNGSLHSRDFIVAGSNYGRIKLMVNTSYQKIDVATPGMPVIISGLNYMPNAGDKFFGFNNEKIAKKLAEKKANFNRENKLKEKSLFEYDENKKLLNIIIKADAQGTSEVIKHSLLLLKNDEVQVNVIKTSVGMITKSDIILAQTFKAIIIGFNIRPNSSIKKDAKNWKIKIKTHSIIYKLINEVKNIIHQMQGPKYQEKILGEALIQKIIYFSKVGNIAGCIMNEGKIISNSKIRLIRKGQVIHEGEIDSLQKGKTQIKKIELGNDFGTHIKNYNDIKEGDIIEAYMMEKI